MTDCKYCQDDDTDEIDEPEEYCTQGHWKAWAKNLQAKISLLEYEIDGYESERQWADFKTGDIK